jgi:hypothetical protein
MPACKRVGPRRRKQDGEVEDGQMHIAFLNPQGNFDPRNSYLASHPDFGGQLVYVREVARTLGKMGHHADILTRRIVDPDWPEFASDTDAYPDTPNVRILRVPCGPDTFLAKEELRPYLGTEFVPRLLDLYETEGSLPDALTAHYGDGGLCAAQTAISEFHDLGAKIVILTRSGGVVTASDNGNVERVGPLPKVKIENVTGARDAFWSALLMAHLDGKAWPEAILFAHEVASLKLRVEGHVERMIDRESLCAGLKSAGQRAT